MLMDCIDRVLTQGGGLWAVRVSGVYVNTVVSFWRVLSISRPLTQLIQGIMGIKEWGCVTLASHIHSSIHAAHWDCVFVCSSVFCVYVRAHVCLCWECTCSSLSCKKKNREKGSHINTSFKCNSMDHLFSETCVLSLVSSQTGEWLRSENKIKAQLTVLWDTDILSRRSWNFKGDNRKWGIASQSTQQDVVFYLLVCLYQPIN